MRHVAIEFAEFNARHFFFFAGALLPAGDELRVEADIEDVIVGEVGRRDRIDEVVGDQREPARSRPRPW